ncbi:MAG: hypothetical protein SF051_01820 [Elusimicrobiota bacterium]|nr:hypothetical protein [Elusimicrobiota bacterium]
MKRFHLIPALAAALAAAGAGPAAAELVLESVAWQAGRVERPPRPVKFADATAVSLPKKGAPRLRAKAVLKNRGPKSVEGILVRYTVAPRLVPDRAVAAEAAWALPVLIDERRVPKIGPNQVLEVPLTLTPALENYLKRIARQGFRANRLKVSAMIETHADGAVRVQEAELEVSP